MSKISAHLASSRISHVADWAVLTLGVLMLTTAIIGTIVTPAISIQADADLETARANAAL
ncbi:MAG: hypothetical protein AAF841_05160 [Pseudomonadota bacterium]